MPLCSIALKTKSISGSLSVQEYASHDCAGMKLRWTWGSGFAQRACDGGRLDGGAEVLATMDSLPGFNIQTCSGSGAVERTGKAVAKGSQDRHRLAVSDSREPGAMR